MQYSSLIVTGQMMRDEALEKLENPPFDEFEARQEFSYVATKLGITPDELQGYMDAPRKSYEDYRSQQHIYTVGARMMRALGLQRGGKR